MSFCIVNNAGHLVDICEDIDTALKNMRDCKVPCTLEWSGAEGAEADIVSARARINAALEPHAYAQNAGLWVDLHLAKRLLRLLGESVRLKEPDDVIIHGLLVSIARAYPPMAEWRPRVICD